MQCVWVVVKIAVGAVGRTEVDRVLVIRLFFFN